MTRSTDIARERRSQAWLEVDYLRDENARLIATLFGDSCRQTGLAAESPTP